MADSIGVIGSGVVGEALANGFLKHGYAVMRGSRDPGKVADWLKSAGEKAATGTMEETAKFGSIIVLAVKGTAAESAVDLCGADNLKGKTVIDATNPIADLPPQNGVLQYFGNINDSLMEVLQKRVPEAHFVKAFSCVGNALMVNPDFGGTKPTMFICGNNDSAKKTVTDILTTFDWETADMGGVEAARAIEPLAILWCIPGFRENRWNHAFKMLTP
ncbi:MAG: DNA-binding protein [candidate division Zixibacteria bacterium]|nr:DNA-binding protein [candidate division Zixibacteria bacterium]